MQIYRVYTVTPLVLDSYWKLVFSLTAPVYPLSVLFNGPEETVIRQEKKKLQNGGLSGFSATSQAAFFSNFKRERKRLVKERLFISVTSYLRTGTNALRRPCAMLNVTINEEIMVRLPLIIII